MNGLTKFKANFVRLFAMVIAILAIVGLGNTTQQVNAAAGDAPSYGQVSAVKFVGAKTNHLSGLTLDSNGKVWTWGYNHYGLLGDDSFKEPINIAPGGKSFNGGMKRIPYFVDNNINVVAIEGGYVTSYAIDDKGVLYAWGYGLTGQMGDGTTRVNNPVPIVVPGLEGKKVKSVDTGPEAGSTTYIMTEDGEIYAWGWSDLGKIPQPTGTVHPQPITSPRKITELDGLNIVDYSVGLHHMLFLSEDGKVYNTGWGTDGRLGHGDAVTQYLPKEMEFFTNNNKKVVQISASSESSLVLTEDGEMYEWGRLYRASHQSEIVNSPKLVEIDLDSNPYGYTPEWTKVVSGKYTNYAIDQHGRIWSWGSNTFYSFGTDGGMFPSHIPGATAPNPDVYGKHVEIRTKATMQPLQLGDGNTQANIKSVKAPVFSNRPNYGTELTHNNYIIQAYTQWGNFSDLLNGRHPTIYDKKYMETVGEPKDIPIYSDTVLPATQADAHAYVYPVDEEGNRLIYVVRRDGGTDAQPTISGNFYIADDSYDGKWIVDQRTKTDLPAGVTEETSLPAIKEKEKPWIGLANDLENRTWDGTDLRDTPYMVDIHTFQSSTLFIDSNGNLYKTSLDGAGAVAWGWDNSIYDSNTGNLREGEGLYNMYAHEIMFMRGVPMVTPIELNISKSTTKIYKTEDNTQEDKITIDAVLPEAYEDKDMNIKFSSELRDVKYVIVPYDKTNPDFNIADDEITLEKFNELYANEAYTKGDLLDETVDGGDTGATWTTDISLTENCRIFVYTQDNAYGKITDTFKAYVADNFYTPSNAKHEGIAELENDVVEQLYEATNDNIVKEAIAGDTATEYGIPLDVNGNVIEEPTFGYDKITISKYDELPTDNKYWNFITPQEESVELTLSEKDHMEYLHTFYYERNMENWANITYDGEEYGKPGVSLDGFEMPGGNELVKKDIEITRTPPQEVGDLVVIGYYTDDPETIYPLEENGNLVFTPTDDVDITFVYGNAQVSVDKTVTEANDDKKAAPGETLSYEIVVKNVGSAPSVSIVKDTLDNVLPYIENGTTPENIEVTITSDKDSTKNVTTTLDELIAGLDFNLVVEETINITFDVVLKDDLNVSEVTVISNTVKVGQEEKTVEVETGEEDFDIVKTVADANDDKKASSGEELTYTIVATNNGTATATDAIIKDDLAQIKDYIKDGNVTVTVESNKDTAKNGNKTLSELMSGLTYDIVAGEEITLVFTVTLIDDLGLEDGTVLKNIVTAGKNGEGETEIPVGEVDFTVTKDVEDENNDTFASPGEELKYIITATNTGSANSVQSVIKDEMTNVLSNIKEDPADVSVVVTSTNENNSGTITLADLIAGKAYDIIAQEEIKLEFVVTVKDDLNVKTVTQIANTVTVGDEEITNTIITSKPGVNASKDVVDANGDGKASSGEDLTYTLTISNTGTIDAKGIAVQDSMSEVLKHIKTSDVGITVTSNTDESKNDTTKKLADLIAGLTYDVDVNEVITIEFTVTVKDDLDTKTVTGITNIAVVDGEDVEKTVDVVDPSFTVVKEVEDANGDKKASPGEVLTYTITATNTSEAIATDAIIKDTLSTVLGNVKEDPANVDVTVTSTNAANVTTFKLSELVAGKAFDIIIGEEISLTFNLTVKDDLNTEAVTAIENSVTVGKDGDETTIETGKPTYTITKEAVDANGDEKASPGETLTYTIIAENTGDVIANNATIQDTLDTVLPYINNGDTPANISVTITSNLDTEKEEVIGLDKLIAGLTYSKIDVGEKLTLTFSVEIKADLDTATVKSIANTVTLGDDEVTEEIDTGKANFALDK
ncbi:hypothetical protein LJB88_02885, partial [Erysipelotrichaceae bacterium OttesenSCG-928-M19]|nr:hypothetical protein [Erysipelotrichaceae bacterium OttesenSCG-928-M19]